MKKIIILAVILIAISDTVLAYSYPQSYKKAFYDNYTTQLFGSIYYLSSMVLSPEQSNKYISVLKTRLDRKELEDATWACISKYSIAQFKQKSDYIIEECTAKWRNNFLEKNKDILESLINTKKAL